MLYRGGNCSPFSPIRICTSGGRYGHTASPRKLHCQDILNSFRWNQFFCQPFSIQSALNSFPKGVLVILLLPCSQFLHSCQLPSPLQICKDTFYIYKQWWFRSERFLLQCPEILANISSYPTKMYLGNRCKERILCKGRNDSRSMRKRSGCHSMKCNSFWRCLSLGPHRSCNLMNMNSWVQPAEWTRWKFFLLFSFLNYSISISEIFWNHRQGDSNSTEKVVCKEKKSQSFVY